MNTLRLSFVQLHMLGRAQEPSDDSRYIDFQEAELNHFEQQLDAEMSGYDSATDRIREALDQVRPKIEEARRLLRGLRTADAAEHGHRLGEYKQARNAVRNAFKRLDRRQDSGGPPLD